MTSSIKSTAINNRFIRLYRQTAPIFHILLIIHILQHPVTMAQFNFFSFVQIKAQIKPFHFNNVSKPASNLSTFTPYYHHRLMVSVSQLNQDYNVLR